MIIVFKPNSPEAEIKKVEKMVSDMGYEPRLIRGVEHTVLGAVGDENMHMSLEALRNLPCIEDVHPIQKKYNHYRHFNNCSAGPVKHSLHAEIAALKSIPYPITQQLDWKRVKIYIYRIAIGLPQKKGFARPCAACRQCIADMGIRDMYYTTDTGYAYERIDMDND